MFRKLFAAVAAIAPLAFAPAAQAHGMTRDHFVHRGTGYHVTTQSNGREMCLKGFHPRTGQRFDLHVSAAGEVSGTFEGRAVAFTDREARSR